jgi:ABC-2 type transport system permease protein
VNSTVAWLTLRGLLGRRRGLLLLGVPVLLLVVSVIVRAVVGQDHDITVNVLGSLALGTMVPLLGLIAGTGAIGPEIDDGSIIYLLAKPQSRTVIILTKLWVAIGCTVVFAAVPTFLAGEILYGNLEGIALAYGIGALVAGVAYSALFLLFGVISRHAVVIGLMYSLLWESVVGGYVPGARTLSIHQWAQTIASKVADTGSLSANVHLPVAVPLLIVVILAATALASVRLGGLTLAGEE